MCLKPYWKHALRLWKKSLPSVGAIASGCERLGLQPEKSITNELRKGWENHVRFVNGMDHNRYQEHSMNRRIGHDASTAMNTTALRGCARTATTACDFSCSAS